MTKDKCYWCSEGFEHNEPRVEKNDKMVFHIVSKKGNRCIEEYRLELRRILQEEERRRQAFEKMG